MHLLKTLALFAALPAAMPAAYATPITYNLLGVTTSAGSLTGTVAIDNTTDLVTDANIAWNNPAVGSPVFNIAQAPFSDSLGPGNSQDYIAAMGTNAQIYGSMLGLYFNTTPLADGSFALCTTGTCGSQSGLASALWVEDTQGNIQSYSVNSGTLALLTPEPASLLLLGTGIFAGCLFRRLRPREQALP